MRLSYITVPNAAAMKMLTASATFGTGFGTSFLMAFCNLFGTECRRYGMKLDKAKNSAVTKLIEKATAAGADGVMNIQYQIHGLTVFVYGVAYKNI